ncbi:hypothetical protein HZY62_04380 [Maribacter polysiphoniae]|uniref:Uncharacterized protein n=1 Tax=Maribacter polysiphoniae TaxID=429344 RepID=A0A316E3K6_9FLAO|nr:hypothetical protein [Maribacter polysiphoniae]MBD1259813.1 hypothetical protein [Maribacter polysiphoniae]PWK25267.1 hypothetical protein LX92_00005 [Maribacter polysiphoniae]
MEDKIVLSIKHNVSTKFSGIKKLFDFHKEASHYYNDTIYIDFYHLDWFDANLSALFGSILAKLKKENNLNFSTDLKFLEEHFNVLFRNGFLRSEAPIDDLQESTVSFKSFDLNDKGGFVDYVENDLFAHRGMPSLEDDEKDTIMQSLIEVYCNIQEHSKSIEPFYVCGQYYPKQGFLAFSMVDLGVGFLPAIEVKTKGKVNNSYDAIKWALEKRNTTREGAPGGLGLFDLNSYFNRTKGNFQIISGDTFWSLDMENTVLKKFNFPNPYAGSILNLFFKR